MVPSSSAVPGAAQWQALGKASALATTRVGVMASPLVERELLAKDSLWREGGRPRRCREEGPQQHQLHRDSQAQPRWRLVQSLTPGPSRGWAGRGT